MSRKAWLILALFAALFAGLLIYGMGAGDPGYVRKNAENLCFS